MPVVSTLAPGPTGPQNGGIKHGLGLTRVGWVPQGDLEHREWVAIGRHLGALGRGSQWWIGDWIRYGAAKWGERYTEAARITGYDNSSLGDGGGGSSQFNLPRRRDKLTFAHHRELASLDPLQQDEWLDRAIALKLTSKDLRVELRGLRKDVKEDSPTPQAISSSEVAVREDIVCPRCGHKMPHP
jgi:hypothetical protein